MSGSGARRRFRVDALEGDIGGVVDPGAGVLRHLRVLRAAIGDHISLFDGRGTEVVAEIVELEGDTVRVRITERIRCDVESPLETCLVQAVPVRATRMETIVRQATELGTSRIVPVLAERSQRTKVGSAGRRRLVERWRRIVNSAAEQCGRARVPLVDDICRFDELDWQGLPRPLVIAHAAGSSRQGAGTLAQLGSPSGVTVLVGPEGGWAEAEADAALAHGASAVRLGPRVLRADSAGAVAMALLQYLWGDLGDTD